MTLTPKDAADALEGARAARAALAARGRCPPVLHAAFGALLAGLVASEAASDQGTLIIEGAIMALGVILFFAQRRRLGFFVNGYRRGRTRPIALGVLGAYLVLFSLAAFLKAADGLRWPALLLGAAMFPIGVLGSVRWQERYLAEMSAPLARS